MINNIIKQRREELGLSQEYVAKAVGVSKTTVSRWESGEIENLRRNRIYNLAKVLQIPPNDLLCDNQDSEKMNFKIIHNDPQDTPLLNIYHRLNTRGKEKVLDYASDLAKTAFRLLFPMETVRSTNIRAQLKTAFRDRIGFATAAYDIPLLFGIFGISLQSDPR